LKNYSPLLNNKTYEATVSKIENIPLKTTSTIRCNFSNSFPIFIKSKFHGFLGFDDTSEEKKWSEDEINILQTLARNITSSIERIKEKKPFMKVREIPFISQ
jgi:hypothetical protein